jgi:hypothetical protein
MGSNPTGYSINTSSGPGDTSGTPSVWIGDDGGIHVIVVGRSSSGQRILRNDKVDSLHTWTGWYVVGATSAWGTPAIISTDGTTPLIIYAGEADDGIHVIGSANGFPQGTQPPPGLSWGTGVSAVPRAGYDGRFAVFVTGNDGRIWVMQLSGLVWGWKPYGGPASSLPAAAGASSGPVDLFFGNSDYSAAVDFPVTIDGVWYPFLNNAVWHKTVF